VETHCVHDHEHDGQNERYRESDDDARAPAEREEADEQDDCQRFDERVHKLTDCVLNDSRLIGDLLKIESPRYGSHEIGGGATYGRPQLKKICGPRPYDAHAACGLLFLPDHEIRWIGETVGHSPKLAEPKDATISFDRRLRDSLGAIECPGHAQRHALC